ncbi:transposase [Streptomyces sp. GMR22]|uniref:transposase n=1 Tax=Streptomyces sp. GMR22 TaxID=2759524 RepID=UPI0015FCB5E2|nr:transposase [Streptomyces sp. GMR22]MBA6439942.1 transposase [Streptomyces sp. GMR22]
MDAVLRVVPAAGETTWSFLHRVAAAYRLEVSDLAEWWRWPSPVQRKSRERPDGEVLLDTVAQGQLAGWCRVPTAHLARALPSWQVGPQELDGHDDLGVGRARWRVGPLEWGPVAFGCRACAARRGAHGRPVWAYRPAWRRWCAPHGRWLLAVGEGHPLEFAEVTAMATELGRAQRRWGRVEAVARAAGVQPRDVFALARAVVCGWWQQEEFWAREEAWGPRLEQVVAATARRAGNPQGFGDLQWRLLVRDVVVFPELARVAQALLDPRLQDLTAADGAGDLVRSGGCRGRVVAALGERLGREWLGEAEEQAASGALASWAQAVIRQRRRPARSGSRQGRYGMWWVPMAHRPVEVRSGLQQSAGPGGEDAGGHGRAGEAKAGAERAELTVPRRVGPGRGLEQWRQELFAQGLEEARRHVEQFGHLALPHTDAQAGDGFDLGRWLANRRAEAASLTREQAAQLRRLDAWWNPHWPVDWQRAWYRARTHVQAHATVTGGDNLEGLPRWLERWLRHQITHYPQLHPDQRRLLGHLGLTEGEVARFHAWPHRRRPLADGVAAARTHAGRHGHLALSRPTAFDGFPLGTWLARARTRQRQAGRPTRLGAQLTALDAWWDPLWPIAWQRMWWACRHHLTGLPDGMTWWPGAPGADHAHAWLTQQTARRPLLQPGQQSLVDDLTALSSHPPGWRPRITDDAWTILLPLLPPLPHHGGRRRSNRQLLEAIVHIACTGQPWNQLPQALGPVDACRHRYRLWHADGTLTRIIHTPLPEDDRHWQQRLADHLDGAASSG